MADPRTYDAPKLNALVSLIMSQSGTSNIYLGRCGLSFRASKRGFSCLAKPFNAEDLVLWYGRTL